MKKPIIRNILAIAALTGALVATGGAANAYGTYLNFNVVAPVASGPVFGGTSDTKAVSYTNGDLRITSVGSTYKVRGLMTNIIGTGGTTQTAEMDDNSYAPLVNHFSASTLTAVQLRVSTFNVVTVQIIGKWRAN